MPSIMQRVASFLRMPRSRPFSEHGTGGTTIYGGYVTTREKSAKWQGQQKYITSSELAVNTSIVAAGVHHFLNLIAHPSWSFSPADEDDAQAVEMAEFVEDVVGATRTPWPRIVRRAGMYRFHGFGIQEWIAIRRDDGRTGLRDVEPRPQHTIEKWAVADNGAVDGVWQRSPQTGQFLPIPRAKMVYLVDDTLTDSPEGLGIFRHLAEPYERLKAYYDLEARTFERDLRGIPVGRIPYAELRRMVADNEMTEEDAKALTKVMEDFVQLAIKQSDTGLTMDSDPYESIAADGVKVANVPKWGLELLQGSANGLGELSNAIDRTQREMARVIGVEHLMMGGDASGGNRALAEDKSRNLYLIANAVLEDIKTAFEKDLIDPLWRLNAFPDELKPSFEVEDVTFKDAESVASTLRDMANAGAPLAPDDPVINDVRELMGVSPAEMPSAEMVALPRASGAAEDVDVDDAEEDDEADDDTRVEMRAASNKSRDRVASKRVRMSR